MKEVGLDVRGATLKVVDPKNKNKRKKKEKKVVIRNQKSQPNITTIRAFLTFSSIYLGTDPTRIQELLKYANIVRTLESRWGDEGWLNYDMQFRMRKHWNPQSSWGEGVLDQELWYNNCCHIFIVFTT